MLLEHSDLGLFLFASVANYLFIPHMETMSLTETFRCITHIKQTGQVGASKIDPDQNAHGAF